MENSVFRIQTEVFEGPLELLLQLIEKRKLFINDVSLAQVTDDFIDHVKAVEQFPMKQAAQFILIASTLLLLKSKSLLPTLNLTSEEEGSIEDLEQRLKTYKYFQELSHGIDVLFGTTIIFPKNQTKIIDPIFSPQKEFTPSLAFESISNVIHHLPKKKSIPQISVKRVVSLEDTIQSLTDRMQKTLRMSFREFAQHEKAEKIDVIIGFLALLQLVKEGVIIVNQTEHFNDIYMETNTPTLPRY